MRSSVDIQFSVCLIRIIPEPSFPSQGSQARGTRLGETLAAAGHVPPRFWEVNLIVTVRGVGKERVCSVLKLQLWVMKFTVNLQQEIVKRTLKLTFIS